MIQKTTFFLVGFGCFMSHRRMKRTSPSKKATDLRSKAGGRSVGKNGYKTIDWYMFLRKALLLTLVQIKLPKIIYGLV